MHTYGLIESQNHPKDPYCKALKCPKNINKCERRGPGSSDWKDWEKAAELQKGKEPMSRYITIKKYFFFFYTLNYIEMQRANTSASANLIPK